MSYRRLWLVKVTCEGRPTVEKQTYIDMGNYAEAGAFVSMLASMSGGRKKEIVKIEAQVIGTYAAKPSED